jgi:hypothetical protein
LWRDKYGDGNRDRNTEKRKITALLMIENPLTPSILREPSLEVSSVMLERSTSPCPNHDYKTPHHPQKRNISYCHRKIFCIFFEITACLM